MRGTATAASLWITGAIGIAVGVGSYDVAIVLALATVITLWAMNPLKRIGHLGPGKQKASDARRKPRADKG